MEGGGTGGPVLVSACLLGVRCRYDGLSRECPELRRRLGARLPVPVCPEQLGGLPTPRAPMEVVGGAGRDVLEGRARVLAEDGTDRTAALIRGAEEALRIAGLVGARRACLKSESPSCDSRAGVAAALLESAGLELESAG